MLARAGIDADTATVGDRWWAQPYPVAALLAPPQRPLREQLQELASDYRQLWRGLTPKQEADEIQTVLDTLVHARVTLNSSKVGFVAYESDGVREAVDAFTVKAERHIARLRAAGNRTGANARKAYTVYWGELVLLWRAITAGSAQSPSQFLRVCSAPVFSETTEGGIRNFLDRLHQTST